MIFVVSTGRSGTMSLAECLNNVEGVRAFHQPHPLLREEIAAFVRGEMDVAALAAKLRETRPGTCEGREYAESNQLLSFAIPALLEAFPSSRFIWLLRDGRDVVSSFLRRGGAYQYDRAGTAENEWTANRIRADWLGEMSSVEWLALSEFERCSWYWSRTNAIIRDGLARVPAGRRIRLRLEFFDGEKQELARRFGLRVPPSLRVPVVNQSIRRDPHHWRSWPVGERRTFERVCSELMDGFYPGWRNESGDWAPVHSFTRSQRLRLRLQGLARSVAFDDNWASRTLLAAARRLPAGIRLPLKRRCGL